MAQHPTEEILNITRKFLGGEAKGGGQQGPSSLGATGGNIDPETGQAIPGTQTFFPGLDELLGRQSRLPSRASPTARGRAFGRQGLRQRRGGGELTVPFSSANRGDLGGIRAIDLGGATATELPGTLPDQYFNLPGPVGFAQTPQGRAILQSILGRFGGLR